MTKPVSFSEGFMSGWATERSATAKTVQNFQGVWSTPADKELNFEVLNNANFSPDVNGVFNAHPPRNVLYAGITKDDLPGNKRFYLIGSGLGSESKIRWDHTKNNGKQAFAWIGIYLLANKASPKVFTTCFVGAIATTILLPIWRKPEADIIKAIDKKVGPIDQHLLWMRQKANEDSNHLIALLSASFVASYIVPLIHNLLPEGVPLLLSSSVAAPAALISGQYIGDKP